MAHLTPDCRGEQDVQRRHILSPVDLLALLKPLGMLVHHGVDDMDERLVAVEQAVAAGEKVAFQPPLDSVFTEDLHDPTGRGEMAAVLVLVEAICHPDFVGDAVHVAQLVGLGLIRPEESEVLGVSLDDLRHVFGEDFHAARVVYARALRVVAEVSEVGHVQRFPQDTTVGHRIGTHSGLAGGSQFLQLLDKLSVLAENLVGLIRPHPF